MAVSDKKFNEMMTHNKMLETQITQLANTLKDYASPSTLPFLGVDPKKPVYSITTRSGRVLEEKFSRMSEEDEKRSDSSEKNENNVSKSVSEEEVQELSESSNEETKEKERKKYEDFKPKLPYPQKLIGTNWMNNLENLSRCLGKFIFLFLSLMFWGKCQTILNFLRKILNDKRDCNVVEPVSLGECCSALIHNDLPQKLKDPGNFFIPCNINVKLFQNALCDLGASVSIIPYSLFKKLKLEIVEDDNIPIILGRPFLATSGALIDVKGGMITLCVDNDNSSFKLKSMH
ncbi:uncharacterized protein LOC110719872 [Chenopodium quinoa]|uniref:uncharacterized protein LOC110719872 n=1 Tax=Chenopodium quinoa TaxID=63459 RepID=UPI000B772A23|nr:uncharacterized protein LOC110719872 [Chenopodium quinoa]